ncbi:MAG: phosphotriesterase [Mycobacteriaceae bacterium]|nr:phosphotriesterase [Mycobacteriaceae bacterium]
MARVQTLRGGVDADELGATLMHEHVFVVDPDIVENVQTDWDEQAALIDAGHRLDELYAAGIHTIVDLTVIGLGRSIPRLQRVPMTEPLNIVVATGIYDLFDIPPYFKFRTTEVLVDHFVREIEEGIGDTGVRAGILKCATDEAGVTPGVEKILRAVARAHMRTGAPISTHTHAGTRRGLDQLKVFAEEGVDPRRVVIGHSGDTTDLDYLLAVADSGAYLGMDRFGIDSLLGYDDRVATVARLCSGGRANQIVLSHDASCYIDYFRGGRPPKALGNWHYLHISRDVIPALKARGVTTEQIDQMLVTNPRRVLGGVV